MKKIFTIVLFSALFVSAAYSQNMTLNYEMSFPSGSVKNFTNKAGFRGFGVNYQQFITRAQHISFGIDIAWNVFYQEKDNISGLFMFHDDDNVYTITGNQYRYVNFVPMLAGCRYTFLNKMALFRPYAGFGVGTSWCEKRTEVGQYRASISRWQFAMSPEVGVLINAAQQIGLNVGARYVYATKAAHGRVPEVSQFTVCVGFVILGSN